MPKRTIKFRVLSGGLYLAGDAGDVPRDVMRRNRGLHPVAHGIFETRDGSAQLHAVNASHSLFYFADSWYAAASTIFYKGVTSKKTGLSGNRLSFVRMSPTAGKKDWLFVAGGGTLFKSEDDGTITGWGIEAPDTNLKAADSGDAGNLNGTYKYLVTFKNSETGHRSNAPTIDVYTELLLHCEGADASTTFTDSSRSSHTVTAAGDAQVDTAQYKFGSASGLFDGNGDYLSIPDSADWNYAYAEFTIEKWVRFASGAAGQYCLYSQLDATVGDHIALIYDFYLDKLFFVVTDDTGIVIIFESVTWNASTETWYHVAVVRGWDDEINSFAITINGTAIHTFSETSNMPDHDQALLLGRFATTREIDFSPNYQVVTFVGTAALTGAASKFGNGALVLDGDSDRLTLGTNDDYDIGTNWTAECFVKHDNHLGAETYYSWHYTGDNRWTFDHLDGTGVRFQLTTGGSSRVTLIGGEITDTNWHHVCVIKVGQSWALYVDGTRVSSATYNGGSALSSNAALFVGYYASGAENWFDGYLDCMRLQHSNPYSADPTSADPITPITQPPAADSNTALMLYLDLRDMKGHMDEIRISGIARYTADFTEPSEAFKDVGEASVTVTNKAVSLTSIPTSDDTQVDQVEIWRTVAGGSVYFLVRSIAEGTTSYIDNFPDSALTSTELPTDNTVPYSYFDDCFGPYNAAIFWITRTEAGERGRVYYSPTGRPEAMGGYIEVATDDTPLQKGVVWKGTPFVAGEDGWYQLYGTDPYYSRKIGGVPGTTKPHTIAVTPIGIMYEAEDGVRIFNGTGSILAATKRDIQRLFRGKSGGALSSFTGVVATYGRSEYFISDETQLIACHVEDKRWRDVGDLAAKSIHYAQDADIIGIGTNAAGIYDLEKEGETQDNSNNIERDIETDLVRIADDKTSTILHVHIDYAKEDLT